MNAPPTPPLTLRDCAQEHGYQKARMALIISGVVVSLQCGTILCKLRVASLSASRNYVSTTSAKNSQKLTLAKTLTKTLLLRPSSEEAKNLSSSTPEMRRNRQYISCAITQSAFNNKCKCDEMEAIRAANILFSYLAK
jgi:hypothetical protein